MVEPDATQKYLKNGNCLPNGQCRMEAGVGDTWNKKPKKQKSPTNDQCGWGQPPLNPKPEEQVKARPTVSVASLKEYALTINSLITKHHLGLIYKAWAPLWSLGLNYIPITAKLASICQHPSLKSGVVLISVENFSKATCGTRVDRQGALSFYYL